jgi:predicted nucleotidyltransferase
MRTKFFQSSPLYLLLLIILFVIFQGLQRGECDERSDIAILILIYFYIKYCI